MGHGGVGWVMKVGWVIKGGGHVGCGGSGNIV